VAAPPPKPLMVFDGDCNFCTFWIRRWQQTTGDAVDYLPAQDPSIAARFPEIPLEQFDTAVQLIETDGSVHSGAEAVLRVLAHNPKRRRPLRVYQSSATFSNTTEWAYRLVAGHRPLFSRLTRWFWGRHVEPATHFLTRWFFLRTLGLIYFVAFVSLLTQINGLIGHNGILPADQFMSSVRHQCDQQGIGLERYHLLPTLCWFNSSDGFLHVQCVAGIALAVLLVVGIAPVPCLALLWLLYLSLVTVGRDFLGFQWDNLLLETGFLAIFFAPLRWGPHAPRVPRLTPPSTATVRASARVPTRDGACYSDCGAQSDAREARAFPKFSNESPPPKIVLWLLRLLLFKLMFSSGCVKLLSGDPAWRDLTALTFHYYTQPLPTWIGWYAGQSPLWFQKFSCAAMFAIELGAPWLIFAPRRIRFVGAAGLASLQVLILLTGNYTFFNWLTLALCVLLLDDFVLEKIMPAMFRTRFTIHVSRFTSRRWPRPVLVPLAIIILSASSFQLAATLGCRSPLLHPFAWVAEQLAPLRTVNNYGLFAVMTTSRREIIVEGSNDGTNWLAYEFKYKPGDLNRRPAFVAPFQPRLDWQMWFAALGNYQQNPWLVQFCQRLLQGSPDVIALLKKNPFPDHPPRYLRAGFYDYHFTTAAERASTGAWWKREFIGEYLPPISLHE
jgi:lipase maturation factor 1